MKTDIKNRSDIEKLINAFYDKIKVDSKIGYFFNDVAKVNWEKHLPRMYDFWENIIFSTGDFVGNPMAKHKELHQKSTMTEAHFQHWNALFNETVDELFIGEKAEEIKQRAANIAMAMMYKTLG
ncbi:group III truncated hemoglobin [Flavobacterium rhamnosiphilum]|uniref:Group III truncated hemoglobin n=1 Tax=Flavobacterium rhamnosiphilum TaxID=2541724 RepID=A0A4R5F8R1_9FLAO|nr:group III truncated hemoglobin [Flavobacterium rhamnosiphilum]TDE44833.1 group III truncated hemoglobin [Flavobacterium rhamnosiphilum]